MLPKPYYEHGGITIYNGDAREILPMIEKADAVITDPPYNVGKDYGSHNDSMTPEQYLEWCLQIVPHCLRIATNQFWVAPRYKMKMWMELLPDAHLIVIPRGAAGPFRQGWMDQFETALACGMPINKTSDLWNGIRLKGEGYFFRENAFGHPGYTPYPIMLRAIKFMCPEGGLVVEPFCGTGTTLVAARDLGRKAIGIELEEKWCEIAVSRMSQELLFTE